MTDKQLIETLENIKEYCSDRKCVECEFCNKNRIHFYNEKPTFCQIKALAGELNRCPENYHISTIEEIIKQ